VGDAPPSAGDTMVLSAKSEPAPEHPFDAAKVPLVFDAVRRELAAYPQRADFKAVAISTDGWGIAFGAADRASAEHGALAQCLTRSKLDKSCRLYAEGMNVVWTDKSLRLPMSADIHESLGLPFSLDALPFAVDVDALRIKNVLALTNHSAYAIKSVRPIAGLTAGGYANPSEATRIVIERCSDYYHAPCLLLTVDGNLTVQVPKTRKVTNVFMLATETQMSTADKQRTAEIYGQKDWRALARGANGGWYPVANAPSEAAAIEAAMAACAQQDSGCHLYAISNFHVDDQ
jgi:hypothetical protein